MLAENIHFKKLGFSSLENLQQNLLKALCFPAQSDAACGITSKVPRFSFPHKQSSLILFEVFYILC